MHLPDQQSSGNHIRNTNFPSKLTMADRGYFTRKLGGDKVFSVEAPKIKFGNGVLNELGEDAKSLGMKKVAFGICSSLLISVGVSGLSANAAFSITARARVRYDPFF